MTAGTEEARVSAEIAHRLEPAGGPGLRFAYGGIGLLNVNWLSPTKIREVMVHGEQGRYMVNYLTKNL